MGLDTNINHKQTCLSIIRDIFSMGKIYKMTHEDILKARQEKLFDSNSWQRLPQYMKEFIRGYIDCEFKHYYEYLIWGWNIEGKFYSKYSEIPDKFKMDVTTQKIKGHHWYKADTTKCFS